MKIQVITSINDRSNENSGMGDGLILIPFLYGLKTKYPGAEITLQCRSHQFKMCSQFWPTCRIVNIGDTIEPCDLRIRTNCTGFWSTEDRLAEKIGKTRFGLICQRFNVEPVSELQHLMPIEEFVQRKEEVLKLSQEDSSTGPIVVLSPSANALLRKWSMANYLWLGVALKKKNYRVLFVGSMPDNYKQRLSANGIVGLGLLAEEDMIALISNASLFVGNDSGLTHLAGLLGIPGIAICGVSNGHTVFGHYESVEIIQAERKCTGCNLNPEIGFDQTCSMFACRALHELTVDQVLDRVLKKLETKLDLN